MRLIDADALLETMEKFFIKAEDEARYVGRRNAEVTWNDALYMIKTAPTIEPERKVKELLPDGTLHLFTDTDLSKVDRVLVSQNGTHYGDLYYADGEPNRKTGKWIPQNLNKSDGMISTAVYYYPKCSVCGANANYTNFCPNCGTKKE